MSDWPEEDHSKSMMYNNSRPMSDEEKHLAVHRACDTFCSTYYNIWFSGIDSQGNLLLSSPTSMASIVKKRPFRALAVYQYLFGLSTDLLDSLREIELV